MSGVKRAHHLGMSLLESIRGGFEGFHCSRKGLRSWGNGRCVHSRPGF